MLRLLRALFVVIGGILGTAIGYQLTGENAALGFIYGGLPGMAFAALLIFLELSFARRFIELTSIVVIGVIFGFVVSYFFIGALELIPAIKEALSKGPLNYLQFAITFMFVLISVITLIQVKDEFKLVIPFVELSRSKSAGRPILLDTSAIIDGRIIDLIKTRIIDAPLIIPRFVLSELHTLADSHDKLKRARSRRGLDILNQIRESKQVEIQTPDVQLPQIEGVDQKLISLAKTTSARILTSDFNLEKVAQVQGVDVINLHHMAKALMPPVVQGERVTVEIVKAGENPRQGVGFLEDGTMVVGEGCSGRIGQTVDLIVKNVIHTSAGRIVFGEPEEEVRQPTHR